MLGIVSHVAHLIFAQGCLWQELMPPVVRSAMLQSALRRSALIRSALIRSALLRSAQFAELAFVLPVFLRADMIELPV